MKKLSIFTFALVCAVAVGAYAQHVPELNNGNANAHKFYARGYAKPGGGGSNLVFHTGGHVLRNAHVVLIFWGFGTGDAYTSAIQGFRNHFGNTNQYNSITQYYGTDDNDGSYGNIAPSNLAGSTKADYFDTSTPPTNVTDAIVQQEVQRVISAQGGADYAAIYEVFIPSGSYSSSGNGTSCGGPALQYCAYHSHYVDGSGRNVKYSIQPWAGCSGCSSFNDTTLDQDHFVCHETREAVSDSLGNAWYDRSGNEADDKCAWSPSPFTVTTSSGTFGYQYEWSNAASGCVQATAVGGSPVTSPN